MGTKGCKTAEGYSNSIGTGTCSIQPVQPTAEKVEAQTHGLDEHDWVQTCG